MKKTDIIRPGSHAKVGDYIREGWDTDTRSIQPPYNYGLVIKTDSIWDGNEIVPPMIEVLWSWGEIEKVSSDELLVINV